MKEKTKQIKSRKWFCRISKINHLVNGQVYEYDFSSIYKTLSTRYDFVMYIIHDKDKSNIHAHFIIQNETQILKSTLINIMPYGDIEVQKGSNLECYNYLLHKNQENKLEYDEAKVICNSENLSEWLKSSKNNTKSEEFLKEIYSDTPLNVLREKFPNEYLIHGNKIEKMKNDFLKEKSKSFRNIKVFYFYGDNLDKFLKLSIQHLVENDMPYYRVDDYDTDPFNGYMGEKYVVFNLDYLIDSNFFSSSRFKLCFSDLPHTQIKSRYNNKYLIYDNIILFSSKNLYDLSKAKQKYISEKVVYEIKIDKEDFYLLKNGEILKCGNITDKKKINDLFSHIFSYRGKLDI